MLWGCYCLHVSRIWGECNTVSLIHLFQLWNQHFLWLLSPNSQYNLSSNFSTSINNFSNFHQQVRLGKELDSCQTANQTLFQLMYFDLIIFPWCICSLTAGPPAVYEYLTTIELNTTNVTNLVIQQLRTILGNISYPFTINRNIQISEVNITTGETQSFGWFRISRGITLCRWLNHIF